MKRAAVNGVSLAYVERGQGPVLLLVHGFPLDHSMWLPQIEALSASYRVIAPDLRGFGQSEVTEGVVTMEQMADDLAALLDALGASEPVHFCGLSMGGYVAWQFWRRHAARLRSLVVCDTRAAADTSDAIANRVRMAEHVLQRGTELVAEAMLPRLFAPQSRIDRPDDVEAIRAVVLASSPTGIAAAQRGMAERPDMRPHLHEIDVPTLVLVGEHDEISPVAEMRAIAEALPRAELLIVPHAGHMATLENPERVNAEIARFLESGERGRNV